MTTATMTVICSLTGTPSVALVTPGTSPYCLLENPNPTTGEIEDLYSSRVSAPQ